MKRIGAIAPILFLLINAVDNGILIFTAWQNLFILAFPYVI